MRSYWLPPRQEPQKTGRGGSYIETDRTYRTIVARGGQLIIGLVVFFEAEDLSMFLFYFILFYFILFYFILFYFILFYFILFILSYFLW